MEIKWIVVRAYGNGKHMNRVYPMWFEWLSQAEEKCEELNTLDPDSCCGEKWVTIPLAEYMGSVLKGESI